MSAKAEVTLVSVFVVHGKATENLCFFLLFSVSSGAVAMLVTLHLDFL